MQHELLFCCYCDGTDDGFGENSGYGIMFTATKRKLMGPHCHRAIMFKKKT